MKNTSFASLSFLLMSAIIFSACKNEEAEISVDDIDSMQAPLEEETKALPSPKIRTVASVPASSDETMSYSEVASYVSPAGPESMLINISTKNGVVTSINVTPKAVNEVSVNFQGLFRDGIGAQVIGKNLQEIGTLSVVSGASLSTAAFNKALSALQFTQ